MDGGRQIVPRPLVSHVQSPYGLLPVRHQRNNTLHSYYAPNSNKGSPGEATSILTPGGTLGQGAFLLQQREHALLDGALSDQIDHHISHL